MTKQAAPGLDAKKAMRVLIVDDDGSMRALLSSVIAGSGYDVVAALEDGTDILSTIRRLSPDIICLDYQLPGRNGLEILREINETVPELDVVFMTGSDDRTVEIKAADEGAAGFLRKPFSMQQVIGELNEISDARRRVNAANDTTLPPRRKLARSAPAAPVAAAVAAAADDAAPTPPAAFNPRNVVVVDDNGSVRLLLKGLLRDLGLNVVHMASNGLDAVSAARDHQPGILCLDVEMPGMSGIDALPLIRQASPRTSVVMVTASATREFVEKASAAGAKGYIVKPVRPAYLEQFIKKLMK